MHFPTLLLLTLPLLASTAPNPLRNNIPPDQILKIYGSPSCKGKSMQTVKFFGDWLHREKLKTRNPRSYKLDRDLGEQFFGFGTKDGEGWKPRGEDRREGCHDLPEKKFVGVVWKREGKGRQ